MLSNLPMLSLQEINDNEGARRYWAWRQLILHPERLYIHTVRDKLNAISETECPVEGLYSTRVYAMGGDD